MKQAGVALYARVSTERQEQEQTILSQMEELRIRARQDDVVHWHEFMDEGYSRNDLVRPDLDRLRDLVLDGQIDRIYIYSPDRLASGAGLMILVEEFREHGVQVIFLKGSFDDTPEGTLMLNVHGAFAEYERVKITERTRRGKLHLARQGVLVGYLAPYGYRFVRRNENQRAHVEIDEYQASIVRSMYRWLVEEQLSTRAIAQRLNEMGVPTARGAAQWQPTTAYRMLSRETFKGTFVYQKAQAVMPSHPQSTDRYHKKRKSGRKPRPREEWIRIRVPAIVEEVLWEAAQTQLAENGRYARRNNKKHQYLLRGLIRCPVCGATYTGAVQHGLRRYRCSNHDPVVSSTGKKCLSGSMSADLVERLTWEAITETLKQPDVLVEEYQRRLEETSSRSGLEFERKQVSLALKRTQRQEDRITDAYINEAMELDRYKQEMSKLGQRREGLERALKDVDRRESQEKHSREALGQIESFCHRVAQGLDALNFEERQQLLRLVVERITLGDNTIRIETVIPTGDDDVQLHYRHPEALEG